MDRLGSGIGVERTPIEREDLAAAIGRHGMFLAGDPAGVRLDLSHRALPRGFKFAKAKLKDSIFRGAAAAGLDFSKADLSGADFSGADLTNAKLVRTMCRGTSFTDAIVRDADLSTCRELNTAQLAGADLTGTKLPSVLASFEILRTAGDASGQSKTLFLSLLAASAYVWLTIGGTKDAALLTNDTATPLPVISTSIPIVSFYFIAPVLLVLLFAYFHISLQRLWELMADLPAVFPDGVPLDKRASPWLLSGLVRSRMALLRRQPPALANLQKWISILLAYCLVPLTLLGCWVRYLPRHDWVGTAIGQGLFLGSIGLTLVFSTLSSAVLTRRRVSLKVWVWLLPSCFLLLGQMVWMVSASLGTTSRVQGWMPALHFPFLPPSLAAGALWICIMLTCAGAALDLRRRAHLNAASVGVREMAPGLLRHLAAAIVIVSVMGVFAVGSIDGINPTSGVPVTKWLPRLPGWDARVWAPKFWNVLRYGSFANLAGAEISRKAGATPTTGGAHVDHRDLRGSHAPDSFLVNADLTGSDLSFAMFEGADARGADFGNANLQGALLDSANLTGANLLNANLAGAQLSLAWGLIPAQIRAANCWPLGSTPLTKDLKNAPYNLLRDYRTGRPSREFPGVMLGPFDRVFLGIDLREMKCEGADLHDIELANSDLRLASFRGSDLTGAKLAHALILRTDFRGARITAAQVKSMRGWQLGQYDDALLAQLKKGVKDRDYTGAFLDDMDVGSLRGAILHLASFARAQLEGAEFEGADLKGVTNLGLAQLFRSDLRGVKNLDVRNFQLPGRRCGAEFSYLDDGLIAALHLDPQHNQRVQDGDFRGASAAGCFLKGLDVGEIDLTNADLTGANLAETHWLASNLGGARLNGADLLFADLTEVKGLTAAQIKSTHHWQLAKLPEGLLAPLFPNEKDHNEHVDKKNFQQFRLEGTDWTRCDLEKSDFSGAELANAVFDRAKLIGARFAGANLAGAGFRDATVEWADFRGAKGLSAWQVLGMSHPESAYFDAPMLAALDLPADHNDTLKRLQIMLEAKAQRGP